MEAMGVVLSAPVELIRVQRHGSEHFRAAVAEMQGWRNGHEDAHAMRCEGASASLWVLDGHGGDGAAIYSAPELVSELNGEMGAAQLPSNERLAGAFEAVDNRLCDYFHKYPEKESGSTVVGVVAARQADDSYSMKLCNSGDSRGVVVRGPAEKEGSAKEVAVQIPHHLIASGTEEPVEWPVICKSSDHKPNHPTEKARIHAAGGMVTEEEPPRLDGNLAVSRGLGDFEYKSDTARPAEEQKVSCMPDVYEVSGLQAGSIIILCCDGVWDVMTSEFVAGMVREWLEKEPTVDLGEVATEIVRTSLARNSRDNVTAMVVQLCDGSDWLAHPDEMKSFDKIIGETDSLEEDVRKQYFTFLQKCNFPSPLAAAPALDSSGRWFLSNSR